MKKIILTLAAILAMCCTAHAADFTPKATTANLTTIAASEAYTTSGIDVAGFDGYFMIELAVSATYTGTVAVTYQGSYDGLTYVTPEGASAIVSTKGTGTYIEQFSPDLARYIRFVLTEDGGVAPVECTLNMGVK